MSAPTHWSLVEAAEAVAAGRISSRELTEALLARIERLQPRHNAFIAVERDAALAQADAADTKRAQGEPLGPLHGVPLAHKDMFYRKGWICTCGSSIRREFRPDVTATALARLDAAGALHVGRLNMSEFAFGPTGHNHHFGPARNAWNPAHIAGGSSSGSGVAVGARMAFGALGSDTGGSIRLPAAANGLVGIKPTIGRVSRFGAMGLSFSLDTIGPLTRTVRDCARMFAAIAGPDPLDPTASAHPVEGYEAAARAADAKGVRIGLPRHWYFEGVAPEVRALVDRAVATLAGLGAEIVEVDVPDHERLVDLANVLTASEAASLHAHWVRTRSHDYGPQVLARILPGFAYPAVRYLESLQMRPRLAAEMVEQAYAACDVLLTPVFPTPLPTIAETDVADRPGFAEMIAGLTRCTRPLNYLGLPGIVVPCGRTKAPGGELPVAIQLAGRPFAEALLFRVAGAYEAAAGTTREAPPE